MSRRRRKRRAVKSGRVVEVLILVVLFMLLIIPLSIKDKNVEIEVGTNYNDKTKITYLGIDISDFVDIVGSIDTTTVGEYELTYKWGIKSVTQKIKVVDKTAPKIEMQGGSTIYVQSLDNLDNIDPGVVVTDNYDKDIRAKRERNKISETEYEFVYTATDSSGNVTIEKRRIVMATGVIYLTFDDGPSNVTPEILDILEKNDVKATFFIVDYSEEDKETIQRVINDGHTLGIHGISHDYATIYSSVTAALENFTDLKEKLLNDFGYEATFIRFPGGASNTVSKKYSEGVMTKVTEAVEQEGLVYYDWNVDVNDAGGARTASKIYDNFVEGIASKRENVVLMHDGFGHEATAEALQRIIDYAKYNGYEFSAISENTVPVQHSVNN